MNFQDEEPVINAELKRQGLNYTIGEVSRNPQLNLRCAPQLLAALKVVQTAQSYCVVAGLLFREKPDRTTKQVAIEVILQRIKAFKQNDRDELTFLELLVGNELANNVGKEKTEEIGAMMLDERFGKLRNSFPYVLYKLRTPLALDYLRRAAKVPAIANSALYVLAKLKVSDALELCEQVIANPSTLPQDRKHISETIRMIRAKVDKGNCPHVTKRRIPKGLSEWSINLDDDQLRQVLSQLQPWLKGGFGKAEVEEVVAVATNLKVEHTVTLRFPVTFNQQPVDLWLEIFRDDEDAIDLYLISDAALVSTMNETS